MLKSSLVYLGQLYGLVIGIVMVPTYIRYLGIEVYGLIGFFGMLQAWLLLLDLGLSTVFLRDAARYRAGTIDLAAIRVRLRGLEMFFFALAVFFCVLTWISAPYVAEYWLKVEHIEQHELISCLYLMGGAMAVRWQVNIYRCGLLGLERQVSSTAANTLLGTLRFVGVVIVLAWISPTPSAFFTYQFVLAVIELAVFAQMMRRAVPPIEVTWTSALRELRSAIVAATALAFTSGMWVVIQNFDKLLLSRLLKLEDYAFYMVALAVANAINLLNAPILQLSQPKFTIYLESKSQDNFQRLYAQITQLVTALMVSVAGTLAVFSQEVLFVWTGNEIIARNAGPILFWYALGAGIVGVSSVPFQIQFAMGRLKLHVIGNIIFGLLLIPGIVIAAIYYGAVGVGAYWCCLSLIWLLVWIPFVHRRLLHSIGIRWYARNVGLGVTVGTLILTISRYLFTTSGSRTEIAISLTVVSSIMLLALALTVSGVRDILRERVTG